MLSYTNVSKTIPEAEIKKETAIFINLKMELKWNKYRERTVQFYI